jgi:hypothetical protein
MRRDTRLEAAFIRGSLLLGLVHEREVGEWAMGHLAASDEFLLELAEVLVTRCELTAIREALAPVADGCDDKAVAAMLLSATAIEDARVLRSARDYVRILGDLRRDFAPGAEISAAIAQFENRVLLSSANVHGEEAPTRGEIIAWLNTVRQPG